MNHKRTQEVIRFFQIKSAQNGFTLLEIMVAIAVMAIAFTAVIKVYSQSVSMNMASNFYAKAPLLVSKLVSEWEAGMAAQGAPPDFEQEMEGFEGLSFSLDQQDLDPELLSDESSDRGDTRLVKLTCIVTSENSGHQYTAESLVIVHGDGG